MKRKFVSNLILLLTLNFLVKPFYILGIEAEVQNQVGPETYGSYFALISFSFLLNIVLDLGITNYNTRNIAMNSQLLQKHFSGILVLRGALVGLYLLILLVCGLLLGYEGMEMKFLAVLGINQALAATILYLRSNLTGLHLFKQDGLISVLDRALLIIMMSVLLWGNVTSTPFQIEWFIYGQTIAYLVSALTAFVLVRRKSGRLSIKLDLSFCMVILKKSFPYALLIFLMMIYYRTDSVMLERMLDDGPFHAGIYAMGFRFFEAANMVAWLFAILLLPIFSRMLKEKEYVGGVVALSFKILFSGAFVLALLCFVFDEWLMGLRYINDIDKAAPVFGLLMFSFVGVSLTYIFGTLLTANGSLKALNWMAVGGVILNVVLNLTLIPKYQALGCAAASLITQGVTALVQIGLCQRIFKFKVNLRLIARTAITIAGVIILAKVSTIISTNTLLNAAVYLAGCFVFVLASGMLSIRGFVGLLKSRE